MKLFISVDMEGISGIVEVNQTNRDHPEYKKGRALMVADVNAAIEGILALGKAEIVVCDGHGSMVNIEPDELHQAAVLVRGTPKPLSQMAGIDDGFDAALFIGYHSMKGSLYGILSHTFSGKAIESLRINGLEVGETAMNAAIAGYYGVPLIFVSGDVAVTKEAKSLNSGIEVAAVKEALSRSAAKCLHPLKGRELIKDGVMKALKKLNTSKPFTFQKPLEVMVRYTNAQMADAVAYMPSATRIDGKTIKFVQQDYLKAFGAFRASVYIAAAVSK